MSLLLLCRGFCLRQIQLLLDVTSALIVHLPFQINESHLGILDSGLKLAVGYKRACANWL